MGGVENKRCSEEHARANVEPCVGGRHPSGYQGSDSSRPHRAGAIPEPDRQPRGNRSDWLASVVLRAIQHFVDVQRLAADSLDILPSALLLSRPTAISGGKHNAAATVRAVASLSLEQWRGRPAINLFRHGV